MPTATCTFRWTEEYSVHISVLDEQHRRLINTVNQLDQALRSAEGSSVVDSVLAQLVNYAGEHFATEESLMQQHSYPALSIHRAQHEAFREKLTGFLQAHQAGKPCVPVSLMLYMKEWLRKHLTTSDQLYSAYLNARGVY
jgi:hemerythrin